MIDVVSIIGTRPQYIKLKPIELEMSKQSITHAWVDTGQHYSPSMSREVIAGLGLSKPIANLKVGSGSNAHQTGKAIIEIEKTLLVLNPKIVIVYGDTNSTLAASLAASKLNIPTAHVEAGLRSFNNTMPEEINRIIVDRISSINFAPTKRSFNQLKFERLGEKSFLTGDVMCDLLKIVQKDLVDSVSEVKDEYLVLTLHRVENIHNRKRLEHIFEMLSRLEIQIQFYVHPHVGKEIKKFGIKLTNQIKIHKPLPHLSMLKVLSNAKGLVTDSGGLQKEAYLLRIPCTTLRNETEWTETLDNHWNVLVKDISNLKNELNLVKPARQVEHFGQGDAAKKICALIGSFL